MSTKRHKDDTRHIENIIDDRRACASAASCVSSVVKRASATAEWLVHMACTSNDGDDDATVGPT